MSDFLQSSHGLVRFKVVETQILDVYPPFEDGFQYTDESFHTSWTTGNPHQSTFDYRRFVAENNLGARVDNGDIDEVWVYAYPYTGMWESGMAGRGVYTRTVTLNGSGGFSLPNFPPAVYNVRIKGAKWLAKTITVDTRGGAITGLAALLRAGDANDDNICGCRRPESAYSGF